MTSKILREIFETLYLYKIILCDTCTNTFAIRDGHTTRFEFPFLEYKNSLSNLWVFTIGITNGTNVWHVDGSLDLNG